MDGKRMNGWIDGGWIVRWKMDGWMEDGWTNGGWMNGRKMDGWMDGGIEDKKNGWLEEEG